MANEYRVCAYWQQVSIDGDLEYRCVALNPLFTSYDWKISDISCFNVDSRNPQYGLCDGEGKCWICSKYSPGGLGYGSLDPSTNLYRLPLIHVIYNLRALLSKCCFWDDSREIFYTINYSTGEIVRPPNHCSKGDVAKEWHSPNDPEYNLPCNGCKTSCPFYTGIEWKYCTDDKLKRGDFVTAKQIQELRFYSDDWNSYDNPYVIFKSRFIDSDIFAWKGSFIAADDGREYEIAKPGTYNFPILDKVEIDLDENSSDLTKVTPTVASIGTEAEDSAPDYPTLIRDLSESLLIKPRFIFPEKDYVHKHWKPDGNKLTVLVFFSTVYPIYIVNDAFVDIPSIVKVLENKANIGELWTSADLTQLGKDLDTLINSLLDDDPDHIWSSSTDGSGLTYVHNVELEIGESQNLYIFTQDINSNWTFNKVPVHDYFYHVFVMQTRWESNWWTDRDYNKTGKIEGQFKFLESRNNLKIAFNPSISISNFYHHHVMNIQSLFAFYSKYYYYRVKTTVVDYESSALSSEYWDFIDNCGRILIKIPDQRLNRYYGWDLDEARLVHETGDVRFEVEYKASNTENFPPNYVVIKPKPNEVFKKYDKKKVNLYIKYHFFEERPAPVNLNRNEELVFPTSDPIVQSPFSVQFSDTSFSISDIDTVTVEFRVDVSDETGRIIGVKTVKFLTQYHQVKCRDFEIFYGWAAEFRINQLLPSGFVAGKDRIPFRLKNLGSTIITLTPLCGDHQSGLISGIGPMWFPYLACDDDIRYHPYGRAPNWCFLPVEGSINAVSDPKDVVHDYKDHRYRGPDDNYVTVFGDAYGMGIIGAACWHQWSYGFYEKISDVYFAGRAATRGEIDVYQYLEFGWALPKFGNVLREMGILNCSEDYIHFFNKQVLGSDSKWVPSPIGWTVFEDLFKEKTVSISKFVTSTVIGDESFLETIDDVNRYRYEDILFARRSSYAYYPNFDEKFSHFYQFKNGLYGDLIQWAFRDIWIPIEREDSNKIQAIKLGYPDYVQDYMWDEVRLVADEGEYLLEFSPPVFALDGSIESDAFLRLGAGPPRYLDLQTLEWKDNLVWDHGNSVLSKYYYYTTESDWNTSVDLWSEAVSTGEKSEAHYYELEDEFGDKTKIYYFRGITVDISNSRFPTEITDLKGGDASFEFLSSPHHSVRTIPSNVWFSYAFSRLYNDGDVNECFEFGNKDRFEDKSVIIDAAKPVSLKEIEIGFWKGKNVFNNKISYSFFPGCSVYGSNDGVNYTKLLDIASKNFEDSLRFKALVRDTVTGERSTELSNILDVYRYFRITFKNWTDPRACFILNYIRFKIMVLKHVLERIKVYENKFYVSTASSKDFNIYGTKVNPFVEPDIDGSTFYLSELKVRDLVGNSSYRALSKLRSRSCGKRFQDRSEEYGAYSDINRLEARQYELFDEARSKIGNTSVFSYNVPISYLNYIRDKFGIIFPGGSLVLISKVPKLEQIQPLEKKGKLWSAAGHKYTWERSLIYKDCCSPNIISRCSWMWTCNDYDYKHLNHAGDMYEVPINPLFFYYHLFSTIEMGGLLT